MSEREKNQHDRCEHTIDMFGDSEMKRTPWTEEEDKTLVELCGTMSSTDIGRAMGRSSRAVRKRLSVLRVSNMTGYRECKPWTDEDVELMMQLKSEGHDNRYIADRLRRKIDAIQNKLYVISKSGVKKKSELVDPDKTMWGDISLKGLMVPLNEIANILE